MIERSATVCNELGMHLRSAGNFVRTAARFKARIRVGTEDVGAVDGKSILGLVTLGAARGSVLTIQAEGPDETEALDTLIALVESGFGE
jgi:phosphocarrier protein HPr/phosphocarrier protein